MEEKQEDLYKYLPIDSTTIGIFYYLESLKNKNNKVS